MGPRARRLAPAAILAAAGCFYSFDNPVEQLRSGSMAGSAQLGIAPPGSTLVGATVEIEWSGLQIPLPTSGRFAFLDLPPGSMNVLFELPENGDAGTPILAFVPNVVLPGGTSGTNAVNLGSVVLNTGGIVGGLVTSLVGPSAAVGAFALAIDGGLGTFEGFATQADDAGGFSLVLPPGKHLVAASSPGQAGSTAVTVQAGQTVAATVSLSPQAGEATVRGVLALSAVDGTSPGSVVSNLQAALTSETTGATFDAGISVAGYAANVGAVFTVTLPAGDLYSLVLSAPGQDANADFFPPLTLRDLAGIGGASIALGTVPWLSQGVLSANYGDGGTGDGGVLPPSDGGVGDAGPIDAGFTGGPDGGVADSGSPLPSGYFFCGSAAGIQAAGLFSCSATGNPSLPVQSTTSVAGCTFESDTIAFDLEGNLWATCSFGGRPLDAFDLAGGSTPFIEPAFLDPSGLAIYSDGLVFVDDTQHNQIDAFLPDAGGIATSWGTGAAGLVDGPGAQAAFNSPHALAFDSQGNLYVSDLFNSAIRKIDPGGQVTTFATGLIDVGGLAIGPNDTLYTTIDQTLEVVDDAGVSAGVANFQSGNLIVDINGVAVGTDGFVYVAEGSSAFQAGKIAMVDPTDGMARIIADSELNSTVNAQLDAVTGLTIDGGLLWFVGTNGIGSLDLTAADAPPSIPTDGGLPASVIALNGFTLGAPYGITADAYGALYVSDSYSHQVVKVVSGQATVLAGQAGQLTGGYRDGPGATALFGSIYGGCVNDQGDVFVPDATNNVIRKIDQLGNTTTYAGDGDAGYADGDAGVHFHGPQGVACSLAGDVFVADTQNSLIRRIDPQGTVSTYAGSLTAEVSNQVVDGVGSLASFSYPSALAVDCAGDLYVADGFQSVVRVIDTSQNVTTVAAGFNGVTSLGIGQAGRLWVIESGNGLVHSIDDCWAPTPQSKLPQNPSLPGLYNMALDNAGHLVATTYSPPEILEITLPLVP